EDAVAHADALRRVVAALIGLREPYRGALMLRYFEGLSPEVIATRLQVPLETVKTRLRRGLAMMREELDASEGRRDSRALPLLRAFPHRPIAAGGVAGGALVMLNAKVGIASGVALALVVAPLARAWVAWPSGQQPPADARNVAATPVRPHERPAR